MARAWDAVGTLLGRCWSLPQPTTRA